MVSQNEVVQLLSSNLHKMYARMSIAMVYVDQLVDDLK